MEAGRSGFIIQNWREPFPMAAMSTPRHAPRHVANHNFSFGSGPVLPTRSKGRQLPGVEQTKPGESGPSAVELQLWGVLLSRPVASLIVSCQPGAAIQDSGLQSAELAT
jgi:hypothetical protein